MRKLLFLLLAALVSGAQAQSCCDARVSNPPAFTWSTKPTCSTAANGRQIRLTDVGGFDGTNYTGSIWYCYGAGSLWMPVGGGVLLYQRTTDTSTTSVSMVELSDVVTIPAGMLGARGDLIAEAYLDGMTSSSNAKTWRFYFGASGGSSCDTNTQITSEGRTVLTGASIRVHLENDGATNAQAFMNSSTSGPYGQGTTLGVGTAAIDTTATSYFCLAVSVAGGETINLERMQVWAYPAP